MRIALIKETKSPVDNRVALAPKQAADLNRRYPQHKIVLQASEIRAFSDNEYIKEGVEVVEDVSDCDILFGIKEARIDTLIPNKHYVFFGHIAKMQEYNRPLLRALIEKKITFSDYEYMVDDKGIRVCAFGWWAGVVGVYYTLRGYGLRTGLFDLPKPDLKFTLEQLTGNLKAIDLPPVKVILTGGGRVSQGAQYVLNEIGAQFLPIDVFLARETVARLSYTFADADNLVKPKDGKREFSFPDFFQHPEGYESDFFRFAQASDVLICCHFWAPDNPVYLSAEDYLKEGFRIRMIGDVTCDIMGSVKSTLRSSTHADPYYDYNPMTRKEEPAFSSDNNVTVMAVDTCPNALACDTSEYFGKMLIENVFEPLLTGNRLDVVNRSTILKNGIPTPRFEYLSDFSKGKI